MIVGQHAADMGVEIRRRAQFTALGGVEEGIVGDAAPEEEREARGEFDVADAVGGAGSEASGIGLDAEEELRADENGAEGVFDAGFDARGRE